MTERLVKIAHPDLPHSLNYILTQIARWQGTDEALNISQIRGSNQTLVRTLLMDGWIAQLEDGSLMMDEKDIEIYGIWEQMKGCGCGNS